MTKIKIKNFGPVKEGYQDNDGWLDVKKVTLFIGNQGSGKSAVAKLITTFMWIEKVLTRGDYDRKSFSKVFAMKDQGKNQFLTYFRLENYFPTDRTRTLIEYKGESFNITLENGQLHIEAAKNGDYPLPQIMYVPAERNFIANVRTPKALKLISPSLSEFVTEFDNSRDEIREPMLLPINDAFVEYNKLNDVVYIKGNDYRIKLTESSSGFQSLVPLFLVSWFLSNSVKRQSDNTKELMTSEQRERFRKRFQAINENLDLTEEQKRIAISSLAKEFTKTAFINVVEEPEQNLFPGSQHGVLNRLIEFNNMNSGNKLIMTTHSPYLVNYLTLAVKANDLNGMIKTEALRTRLNEIVPLQSTTSADELAIYEMNEKDGTIVKLANYKGLPDDDNYLNEKLAECNELFAKLLEIQQEI
ncbi:MAG: AAA family ATPase [Bacteroidetes bacterium]|nr:AAA family ATPase [Bacteroidota bacterium]